MARPSARRGTEGRDPPAVHEHVASMGEYGYAVWSRTGQDIAHIDEFVGTSR